MKLILTSLLFSAFLSANALDIADVAGTYVVDLAETQQSLEREIAAMAKEGKSTAEREERLKEFKEAPEESKTLTYVIAPNVFVMKVGGHEFNGAYSEIAPAADQVDFTMTINNKSRKIRIQKFKDDMLLMTNREGPPAVTIVLKKSVGAAEK